MPLFSQGFVVSNKGLILAASLVALAACLFSTTFFVDNEPPLELTTERTSGSSQKGKLDGEIVEAGYVMVGGVKRPASDVAAPKREPASGNEVPGYGVSPRIPRDANPQVQAAAEAIRTGEHPERLSVAILPKPFDAATYRTNPKAYLDAAEPARVWQALAPGPGVPRLGMLSERYVPATQGEPVKLQVTAPAGAPVSFTAFDGGMFAANRLSAITVAANDEGVAEVEFVGTPGVIEDVHVLAASPLASGQIKFVVNVQLPQ